MFSLLFSTDILSLKGQCLDAYNEDEFYISQTTQISQIFFWKRILPLRLEGAKV